MKKYIIIASVLINILILISSCSIFSPSQKKTKVTIDELNFKIDSTSTVLKQQLKDLPTNVSEHMVVLGNTNSETILINTQGGPMTSLQMYEYLYMIHQAGILPKDSLLFVNVHQYQTLRTKEFETGLINYEDAKKFDEESTKYLAETVKYFKNKDRKVVVLGISFGAFVVEDLLTNYEPIADKYIIVVGRLDMPEEVWTAFSKGNYVGFKYKKGVPHIEKFTAKEAGMGGGNSIGDKNTSILAAGLGYKRFTVLLKDKDLSKVEYVYGTKDDQVGRLSSKEINFLQSKGITPIKYEKDHSGTIDEFIKNDLKQFVFR